MLRTLALLLVLAISGSAQKPRARDLGIPLEGAPGPLNAITDVQGIEVGHTTLISGEGKLEVGIGPVRTGVTAIHPRGKASKDPVFGAWFPLNGNGEMTGTHWIEESGFLEGPILLTNTHSVGVVRDAVVAWQVNNGKMFQPFSYPVVAETYDGSLNDINGFHVKDNHVRQALETASTGAVAEGNVGGGTGMRCLGFKCGIGTASRVVERAGKKYTVGVLVQANFGSLRQLRVAGVPVGQELFAAAQRAGRPAADPDQDVGSIIVVVATDAPLLPHQIKRFARRAGLGIARTGGVAGNESGDIFVAFSTANPGAAAERGITDVTMLRNGEFTPLFEATVQATEEAVLNALVAADTMTGINGNKADAIPHDKLKQILQQYNRLRH